MMLFRCSVLALVMASSLTVSVRSAHGQKRLGDRDLLDQQEVCGRVTEVSCLPDVAVTIETPGGILVTLKVHADAKSAEVRETMRALRRRNVCATGTLNKKANSFSPAQFTVPSLAAVAAQEGDPLPDWVPNDVARSCDAGFVLPRVKKMAKPSYPQAAMSAGAQGAIWIAAIVDVDGRIREARVVHALDAALGQGYGVNEEAIKTVRKWEFEPAQRDGAPIRALVTIELTFTLKNDQPPR